MDFSKIGKEIYFLRKTIGMSQKELAAGICSQAQISKIERGDVYPYAPTLYLIGQRLGVDINYFFHVALTSNYHYVKEAESHFTTLRREEKYEEILNFAEAEKKNPLYRTSRSYQQLIMWHEAIGLFNLTGKQRETLAMLDDAISLTSSTSKIMTEREMEIFNTKCVFLLDMQDYESLLQHHQTILQHLERAPSLSDKTLKTRIYFNCAKARSKLGHHKDSIQLCQKGIQWCFSADSLYLLPELHYWMGRNYEALQDSVKAIQYLKKAGYYFKLLDRVPCQRMVEEDLERLEGSC
ncbi:XRE family transcriptional regulator [Bacillus sp. FJAT-42376]|uniref:helix-turn-helix domain-containing protein n=1 Tax=Bacillus sp. FJAT-42376 TaxID=2014076 RepID=UPI000F516A2B|nr:helix-turn-helix domain-containing protein [Bacillus sp. FJAT-42376]AZB44638.1 XRE family transcriptional regulator [Bacillus sp. FJAT-42376]